MIPDSAVATLNFRYAPDRTPESAAEFLRSLTPDGATLEITSDSPPAAVVTDTPLVLALRDAGDLTFEPKQAWTNVADFTTRGIDAINFGPGATRYAHRRDELVEVDALVAVVRDALPLLRRLGHADLPHPQRPGDVPVPSPQPCGRSSARGGPRGDRLRDGRPPRADRRAHHRGAARRRARADGVSRRGRPAGAARAVAGWVERRFGATLDPEAHVIPTLGSKEAIFSFAQVVLDIAGGRDTVVLTEPGYPVGVRGALFAGGRVEQLPLLEQNGFLPDLDAVPAETWRRTALLWVNYPNNPTGVTAPLAFYERLAALAREHDFVFASDEAYTELWFDEPPVSALQLDDWTNLVVFNTLSKRSSMTGYRSGFVAGDPTTRDVVGVHLVGGLVGTLLIGFLATEAAPAGVNGLFYGGGVDAADQPGDRGVRGAGLLVRHRARRRQGA